MAPPARLIVAGGLALASVVSRRRRGPWLTVAAPGTFARRLLSIAGPALVGPLLVFLVGPHLVYTANPDEFEVPFRALAWPWLVGAVALSWAALMAVGAVASLHQVDIVGALPKTRSGKILRKTMREMADGKTPTVPGTIEDASVLASVRIPVLVIGAVGDPLHPEEVAKATAAAFPNGELWLVDSPSPMLTHRAEVRHRLVSFFAG